MSIVRTDELTTHLGTTSAPNGAQAHLNSAEVLVAAYLSMSFNRRGNPLQEHTISERIIPARHKTFLEVGGGPVTGIESIAYNVKGYRHTGDEVGDDMSTETETFDYVFNPDFSGWTVSGKTEDGNVFVFQRGEEYRVTYRTGWCAGNSAYTWEWFRTDSSDTWEDADRLGWGFVDGTSTDTNDAGGLLLGPQPTTLLEDIHYETGGDPTDERLLSPALSFNGADYPFIVARLNLVRASTTGYPCYRVGWLNGDGRTYFTAKKSERSEENFLPDRLRASTLIDAKTGYTNLVADMGFNPASDIEHRMQDPVRSWIDKTITQICIELWDQGAADPNGALYSLDYITICDGTARLPTAVKVAILMTAQSIGSGAGSGIESESIGDYSMTWSDAGMSIPPSARTLLVPYMRPSW